MPRSWAARCKRPPVPSPTTSATRIGRRSCRRHARPSIGAVCRGAPRRSPPSTAGSGTGAGQGVEISSLEAISTLVGAHRDLRAVRFGGAITVGFGGDTPRQGYHGWLLPWVTLPCKDGYVTIISSSVRHWQRYLDEMEGQDWTSDPRIYNSTGPTSRKTSASTRSTPCRCSGLRPRRRRSSSTSSGACPSLPTGADHRRSVGLGPHAAPEVPGAGALSGRRGLRTGPAVPPSRLRPEPGTGAAAWGRQSAGLLRDARGQAE